MTTHLVKVPDVGEGVAEVELVSWSVSPGDEVSRNQVLAEVMTDKANVEIPSPVRGTVVAIHGDVGATLAVGTPLLELEVAGAAPPPGGQAPSAPASTASSVDNGQVEELNNGQVAAPSRQPAAAAPAPTSLTPGPAPTPLTPTSTSTSTSTAATGRAVRPRVIRPPGERPRAAPAVRHRARQAGVELRMVAGTGPAGRITHEDLDAYLSGDVATAPAHGALAEVEPSTDGRSAAPAPGIVRQPDTSVTEEPIIGIRRRIAENTLRSTQSIPHITYVEEIDVTALEDLRATVNEDRPDGAPRLTLLPFLIRALVLELPDFASMNAHVDDDAGVLRRFGGVHVGIATQTDNGLMVPVIRHAEAETIWSLAERVTALAEAARSGTAARNDLTGSTITITSLGPLGGLVTTPVINKPEVAIIGVNKIVTRPVWIDGGFVPRRVMNLSSSFDHRVVDGWDAATFVQALRRLLEQPALLFIDRP